MQELLRLDCKLHGELVHHFFHITVHNQSNCLLFTQPPLVTVEDLIFTDLGGGCFMFQDGSRVLDIGIREGMGSTVVGKQQAVALLMVAGIIRFPGHFHQSPVAVLAATC